MVDPLGLQPIRRRQVPPLGLFIERRPRRDLPPLQMFIERPPEVIRRERCCCGPSVTAWFLREIGIFTAEANRLLWIASHPPPTAPIPGGGIATALGIEAEKRLLLRRLGLRADYKRRRFVNSECPKAWSDIVTLCGRCVSTNQLGNIMFGVIAQLLGLVDEARNYGRGTQSPRWIYDLFGATGPVPNWTALGQAYRETAFDIGILVARGRNLCDLMDVNPQAPVDETGRCCTPCFARFTGPQTNMASPPLVTPSGN